MCSQPCAFLHFCLSRCQAASIGRKSSCRRRSRGAEVALPIITTDVHRNTKRSSTLPPNVRREGHSPGTYSTTISSSARFSTAGTQNRNSSLPVIDTAVDAGTPLGDLMPVNRQASHRSGTTVVSPARSPIEPITSAGSLAPVSVSLARSHSLSFPALNMLKIKIFVVRCYCSLRLQS